MTSIKLTLHYCSNHVGVQCSFTRCDGNTSQTLSLASYTRRSATAVFDHCCSHHAHSTLQSSRRIAAGTANARLKQFTVIFHITTGHLLARSTSILFCRCCPWASQSCRDSKLPVSVSCQNSNSQLLADFFADFLSLIYRTKRGDLLPSFTCKLY